MNRTPQTLPILFCTMLFAVLAPTPALRAQAAAPPAAAPPQEAAPIMQFPATGITLEEAVRLTLLHDPNIKRSENDVRFAEGLAQQLRGLFDAVFNGSAEYTHRTQEMSDSAKKAEIDKRQKLQSIIDNDQRFFDEVQRLRPFIEELRNAPPGGIDLDTLASINPTVAATVGIIDQLILTTPDPAARAQLLAIRSDFLIGVSNELGADIDAFEADFARNQERLNNLGPAPIDEVFIDASGVIRVDKLFRSGIFVSPFFDATFQGTNFKDKPRAAEFGGKNVADQMQFRAGIDFTLPLLRGRGAAATAAQERAALIELEASRMTLTQSQATSVLNTVSAYWSLRAAQDAADIAALNLKFQEQALAATKQLIAAQQLAGIEEARAQAAMARAQAQLEDAQRGLHESRVALADAMGVAVSPDPATLPRAADQFPQAPTDPAVLTTLVEEALKQRQDLAAAARVAEAGEVLVTGARRNLSARFDVSGSTFYTALDEGTGPEALDRWVGPSGRIALDYEKPLGNNTARGQLAQAEADLELRRIARMDLERQIRLSVVEAAGSLQQAAAAVQQSQASLTFYQRTIESMMRLLQAGQARLIDAITTQQQQTDAMLAAVRAQQELAQRLARLRYQTGGLLVGGKYVPREAEAGARERK
jgi:outer membrane protein TolC